MNYKNIQAIILAAGKSSRFKTGKNKLLEKICGQEMVLYPTRLCTRLNIPTTVVVGFQRESVQACIEYHHGASITCVEQHEQLGTGHAILCSKPTWHQEHIVIMNGDMPLITEAIIQELYEKHINNNATLSFVTAHNVDLNVGGYGRVVHDNGILEIVEAKHFTGDPSKHCCINAGIYLVKREFLETHIEAIEKNDASKEFYFTDLIKLASTQQLPITTTEAPFDRVRGINNFQELWAAEQIKRGELIKYWMDNGVRFSVAQNVHIDLKVTIGAGSTIGCGVHLLGETHIGSNVTIQEFSSIDTTTIGDNATIAQHCVIKNSTIANHATVGPFAHLHSQTTLGEHSVVGNFVEIKKSSLDSYTKAKHLAYLGDAQIGSQVNIGAGTIICNHNGFTKNKTIIENKAYIGSNNTLVAPITIGEQSFTAAGSVITQDVPAHALAIGRAQQVNKEGYAQKLRERAGKKDDECASAFRATHEILRQAQDD